MDNISYLVGGWATPLKNTSQLGWLFPMYGKIKQIKHVPNHQPDEILVWVKIVASAQFESGSVKVDAF